MTPAKERIGAAAERRGPALDEKTAGPLKISKRGNTLGFTATGETVTGCYLRRSKIIAGMRYVKGWPTRQLSLAECATLTAARSAVAGLYDWPQMAYTEAETVFQRYAELLDETPRTDSFRLPEGRGTRDTNESVLMDRIWRPAQKMAR